MKTVYGPVPSWRLGRSLGVDITAPGKTCSFDCVYCQIGPTICKNLERSVFVPTEKVISDFKEVIKTAKADIVTFSGRGEPTLSANIGNVVKDIKKFTKLPVAILTNSSLLSDTNVRNELQNFDIVVAKLDTPNQELFERINKPAPGLTFEKILSGLKTFRSEYSGKLALQMMFIEKNKSSAPELAKLAREIKADEVQLDTPLRPCPETPLPPEDLEEIEKSFKGLNTISVYKRLKPVVEILDLGETKKRRPVM